MLLLLRVVYKRAALQRMQRARARWCSSSQLLTADLYSYRLYMPIVQLGVVMCEQGCRTASMPTRLFSSTRLSQRRLWYLLQLTTTSVLVVFVGIGFCCWPFWKRFGQQCYAAFVDGCESCESIELYIVFTSCKDDVRHHVEQLSRSSPIRSDAPHHPTPICIRGIHRHKLALQTMAMANLAPHVLS